MHQAHCSNNFMSGRTCPQTPSPKLNHAPNPVADPGVNDCFMGAMVTDCKDRGSVERGFIAHVGMLYIADST